MPESPEEQFQYIADRIKESILKGFPNPSRIGCPGEERIKEVAVRSTLIKDVHWEHITHCSECYAEFIQHKDSLRQEHRHYSIRRRYSFIIVSVIACVCALLYGLAGGNGLQAVVLITRFNCDYLGIKSSEGQRKKINHRHLRIRHLFFYRLGD